LIENGVALPSDPPQGPGCLDWSWDNRYLLMCMPRGGINTHLLRISVADGRVVDVLGDRTPGIRFARFSPDGKFIAFGDDVGWRLAPVSIVPAQGGEHKVIAKETLLMDWSLDGRYLIIGNRAAPISGPIAMQLFAVPIQNGEGLKVMSMARSNCTRASSTRNRPTES